MLPALLADLIPVILNRPRHTIRPIMVREAFKWRPHEDGGLDTEPRGGSSRSSDEGSVMELQRRG